MNPELTAVTSAPVITVVTLLATAWALARTAVSPQLTEITMRATAFDGSRTGRDPHVTTGQ